MSRIGKKPIPVPKGVKVGIDGRKVKVEGPGGTLTMDYRSEVEVAIDEGGQSVTVTPASGAEGDRFARAMWGTTRANINNMMVGVTAGYEKVMEVQGVGYTAELQGKKLRLMVGFANPIFLDVPDGLKVTVEKQTVTIKGADKRMVGQFAADMRAIRKPEPYNGKGIKYRDETIRRKQGKQFGS